MSDDQAVGLVRANRWQTLVAYLLGPIDPASIAVFRIAFGFIVLWEVVRYFANGWITDYFITPRFHFSYFGFSWVSPLSGNGMYYCFALVGLLAFCIGVGFCYRAAITLFTVTFTYIFLLEEARWLNHFYLVILLSSLMIFIPANRAFSVDSLLHPQIRSRPTPRWALWIVLAQLSLVYVFGALAKLSSPDWLHGQPMSIWLAQSTDFPLIGTLFTQPWMGVLFSYGGLLFDLLFVPLVLWRRTRPLALTVGLMFHLTNARLFSIGIFPWTMIAANTLFLPPDWPRILVRRLSRAGPTIYQTAPPSPHYRLVFAAIGIYFTVQLLVPLRHFLYPGDVNWTQQGDRFAWRMKLNDLQGTAQFIVTDPVSGMEWQVDPATYLTEWQIVELVQRPDMVLQFAQYLAAVFRGQGYDRVEVRVQENVSLNGHPPELVVDPGVDLASQPRTLGAATWILPAEGQNVLHRLPSDVGSIQIETGSAH